MRVRLIVASAFVLSLASSLASAAPAPPYYLALGDSLALGTQPNTVGLLGPTSRGYVDDLYALYRLRHPDLLLAKLGCSGETTTSMLGGGTCPYDLGTQLAQAADFIRNHRVVLITLSIGGDDVLQCFNLQLFKVDEPCVFQGLGTIGPQLGQILEILRGAAGRHVPIVGMNYYDPFLAAATLGPVGEDLAAASLVITTQMNDQLGAVYSGFRVPVANVARAFRITDTTVVPGYSLPVNVLLELAWTWVGALPPVGPDIHPNSTGYAVIAGAFTRAIGPF